MTGVTCPIEKCHMSRPGSSRRRGLTFISWKKSTVPKSAEERGPPLCPDWDRASRAMMSRRTKSARSCRSPTAIPSRGMAATLPDGRGAPQLDSRSGVVVAAVPWIRDHAGAHRPRHLLDPIPHAARGAEAPELLDPVEADAVGPSILLLRL